MGFFDLMEGYRKSDALVGPPPTPLPPVRSITAHAQLGQTYFDGLHNDPESVQRLKNKYNFHSSNLLLLRLSNC
jgi:hypothetical protein